MMRHIQAGYSVTEVLIVVVTIGILASIGLVSYNGIQNSSHDAAVRSDLDAIGGVFEAYAAREDASNTAHQYPRTPAILNNLKIQASKKSYDTSISYNFIYCIANTGANPYKEFLIIAKSKSGKIFTLTHNGFTTNSLTQSNLTSNACTGQGMELVSNGLSAPNTWQSWVGDA